MRMPMVHVRIVRMGVEKRLMHVKVGVGFMAVPAVVRVTVVSVGESTIGASVSLENGEVTYSIGDRFQELASGEVVQDSFSYTLSDNEGATATGMVNVNIVGVMPHWSWRIG